MTVFNSGGANVAVTSNTSSQDETLVGSGDVLRIVNNSATLDCFVKVGVGPQTATTDDFLVPQDSVAFLAIGFDADTVAMLSPSGSANVTVMRGSAR